MEINAKYCSGCAHWRPADDGQKKPVMAPCCHYILDVGHSRGCPAGEGCTRYEEKKRGKRAARIDIDVKILGVISEKELEKLTMRDGGNAVEEY